MPERCQQCERYERKQRELHEHRMNLWRRGELTDAVSQKLAADEQRMAEELKAHQAAHGAHALDTEDAHTLTATR